MEGTSGYIRKGDAKVTVELAGKDIEVIVHSKLKQMFERHIKQAVKQVLHEEGIHGAKVLVEDEGALDFAIRARTRTAVRRSRGE